MSVPSVLAIPVLVASAWGQSRPFPDHTAYPAAAIAPSRSQGELDDDVRAFYDQWKAAYVVHAGTDPYGDDLYRVTLGTTDPGHTVSEGQGYGMVITAIMAGHDPDAKQIFDGLWRYSRTYPSVIDGRLMAWYVPPGNTDSAFDGDADIAYGLLLAHAQWGSSGALDYASDARVVLDGILASTIGPVTRLPMLGDWVDPAGETYRQTTPRSSDLMPGHFRAFERATGLSDWGVVARRSELVVDRMQASHAPSTGLLPDFIVYSGGALQPAPPNFLEGPADGSYYYNAGRVPLRLTTDALLNVNAATAKQVRALSRWIETAAGGDPQAIKAGYRLDGTPLPGSDYFTTFFAAPFGVAAMASPAQQDWLDAIYDAVHDRHEDYYEDSVTLLSLLVMTGNFWDPTLPAAAATHGVGEPLAEVTARGTLAYGLYAAEGEALTDHRVPDFSHAGYRGGGVALPVVPVVRTPSPVVGDDRAVIQAAIDEVSALPPDADGIRGAVLLTAGDWEVSDTLVLHTSGVVLRGEGQGLDGTVLTATRTAQHDLIRIEGSGSGIDEVAGTRATVTSARVPVGARQLEVDDASAFSVGDTIAVERTPNQAWIDLLGMGQWGWTPSSYAIAHERRVAAVHGNTLTLDIPLVDALDTAYGGGVVYRADLTGRVSEVGVEDLRLVSVYTGPDDEDHAWVGVELHRATNSWVKGVTVQHFGYAAVSIEAESAFNTVEECAMLDPVSLVTGGRRYSFNVGDGIGNLFQRCYSDEARHDFVTGSRTTGPNVWLDCVSERSTADDGPHHRWSTGVLLDNVLSHEVHVENRQDSGSGHGWSGAQVLFWNAVAERVRSDAPRASMNWTVGVMGEQDEGGWAPEEPFGWWESHGAPVDPRSLYLKQLEGRRGAAAVQAVTTPEQRAGRIWGQLAAWGGEGRLADATPGGDPSCATGVSSGLSCCAATCGTCGGAGCGGREGGADACCTGQIEISGVSCGVSGPPCILDPPFSDIAP